MYIILTLVTLITLIILANLVILTAPATKSSIYGNSPNNHSAFPLLFELSPVSLLFMQRGFQ